MSIRPGTAAAVVAAGGVLWRTGPGHHLEIAVVHRPRHDDWSLPKGKLDRDESAPAAAARELLEETGFTVQLGHRLGEVCYPVPEGRKVVHWWSARAVSGVFVPGEEVDELRWVSPDAAELLLTYPRDRDVLGRFRRMHPVPVPLLLVRHAEAGERGDWRGADERRPLTDHGRSQARRLVGLLRLFGPSRVHSAPSLRCLDTVVPLADALGVRVHPEPRLGEQGFADDPGAGLHRLLALARAPGVAVVCSQGGVIPELVCRLTGAEDPPARKASIWVLGFGGDTGDRAVTGDYYPPPG